VTTATLILDGTAGVDLGRLVESGMGHQRACLRPCPVGGKWIAGAATAKCANVKGPRCTHPTAQLEPQRQIINDSSVMDHADTSQRAGGA
jgi:hypothetical protein